MANPNALTGLALICSLCSLPVYADNSDDCIVLTQQSATQESLSICKGFATTVSTDGPFDTLVVGDDALVSVSIVNEQSVSVIARELGATNLLFYRSSGELLKSSIIDIRARVTKNPTPTPIMLPTTSAATTNTPPTTDNDKHIVVKAGNAEIVYDCSERCVKLDR
ncbi:MAG: pilus assembly protein N-terminal domain-containing protein [Gammaproteobacteria bacterium]|nr:pilus assembly protein N-terminal domain-containing protein [Gammaproteobacteria bacterium]